MRPEQNVCWSGRETRQPSLKFTRQRATIETSTRRGWGVYGSLAYCARPVFSTSSSCCIAWMEWRARAIAKALPSSTVAVINELPGTNFPAGARRAISRQGSECSGSWGWLRITATQPNQNFGKPKTAVNPSSEPWIPPASTCGPYPCPVMLRVLRVLRR
jgi:hypothetical protein